MTPEDVQRILSDGRALGVLDKPRPQRARVCRVCGAVAQKCDGLCNRHYQEQYRARRRRRRA